MKNRNRTLAGARGDPDRGFPGVNFKSGKRMQNSGMKEDIR